MEWKGYVIALMLLIATTIQSLLNHAQFKYTFIVAMRIRTLLTSAIYRKVIILYPLQEPSQNKLYSKLYHCVYRQ